MNLLNRYQVQFHPDKVNHRTDINDEQKAQLIAHSVRLNSIKAHCDEELKYWIFLRALEEPTSHAKRYIPHFI